MEWLVENSVGGGKDGNEHTTLKIRCLLYREVLVSSQRIAIHDAFANILLDSL